MAQRKKPRATCTVTEQMKAHIEELAIEIKLGRGNQGMAYRRLVALACENPHHPKRDFDALAQQTANGAPVVYKSCVIDIKAQDQTLFQSYARIHRIGSFDGVFTDMIYRGLSFHLDQLEK
ncbi:hypothetical protein [Phenylobacterium sp.]|jgi:hypothetical protein|uniref:hypothetical protein n=1 Tax=Phenylobacterium sp. TaxID=1871053 RepID=UPI0035AE6D10